MSYSGYSARNEPGEVAAPLFDYTLGEIYAPVVIVVNVVACTHQKGADIAAKIQDFTTLPNRTFQQLVEVRELRISDARQDVHDNDLPPREKLMSVPSRTGNKLRFVRK